MVLEAVLYFVLGFLGAGLLALMISPAIWNRAVVLTKRKIESSVPLTLNEIQADKDQLRAEFAMSTRRLEMSVDELRAKATSQLAEISRKRDEVVKFDGEKTERIAQLREIEAKSTDLNRQLEEREIQLEETSRRHDKIQNQYVETLEQLSQMRTQLAEKEDEVAGQRIEIAARDTKIDALNDVELLNIAAGDSSTKQLVNYKRQMAELRAELKRERLRVQDAENKAMLARDEAKSATERLEKHGEALHLSRTANSEDADNLSMLSGQLMDERAKTVDLEARLATQALKMEALIERASEHNIEAAAKTVKQEVSTVQRQLNEVKAERDTLQEALDGMSAEVGDNWSEERRENAMLRERMNDMAAKIAVMTAEMEGPSSPVNKLLAKEARNSKSTTKADIKDAAAPAEVEGKISLAARIRAIQQASSSGN